MNLVHCWREVTKIGKIESWPNPRTPPVHIDPWLELKIGICLGDFFRLTFPFGKVNLIIFSPNVSFRIMSFYNNTKKVSIKTIKCKNCNAGAQQKNLVVKIAISFQSDVDETVERRGCSSPRSPLRSLANSSKLSWASSSSPDLCWTPLTIPSWGPQSRAELD